VILSKKGWGIGVAARLGVAFGMGTVGLGDVEAGVVAIAAGTTRLAPQRAKPERRTASDERLRDMGVRGCGMNLEYSTDRDPTAQLRKWKRSGHLYKDFINSSVICIKTIETSDE
jgi:hypothetical protein